MTVTDQSAYAPGDWHTLAGAYDTVAQCLEPAGGATTIVRCDTETARLISMIAGIAAEWAKRADPTATTAELAHGMRAAANTIREVESIGQQGA